MIKKRIRLMTVLAVSTAICMVTACGSDNSGNNPDGAISVTLDKTHEPVTGSGNMSSKSMDIPDGTYQFSITGINSMDSTVTINITPSGGTGEIEVDDNLMEDISLAIDAGNKTIELTADPDKTYKNMNCTVTVNAPVDSIKADGAAGINYAAPQDAETVAVAVSGTTSVTASGSCAKAGYQVSGGTLVDASALKAGDADVEASGAADISVYAAGILKIEASGASTVAYSGSPESVDESVSGTAKIKNNE